MMKYLFGPVPSRRLGLSLGVDLIPRKTCSFDCIYCEVGRTTHKTLSRREYFPTAAICAELRDFWQRREATPDFITLSGSGEPTLHVGIREIITYLKENFPVPVAVLTNGSLLYQPEVRRDLQRADVVLPSLDAVSPEVFQAINRPVPALTITQIIDGLKRFREEYSGQLWLEILFLQGLNDTDTELARLKAVTADLNPDKIHLNTAVRPGPEPERAVPLSAAALEKIARYFGPPAEVIAGFEAAPAAFPLTDDDLLATLARRPQTARDLAEVLGRSEAEVLPRLKELCRRGLLKALTHQGQIFYQRL